MRLWYISVVLLWLNVADAQISKPGSYVVLCPQEVVLGSKYTIYFKLLRPVAYETVTATIVYLNYTTDGKGVNNTIATGSLSLPSGTLDGVIELDVPKILNNPYYMVFDVNIKGTGVLNFENSTTVRAGRSGSEKDEYLFIQTDKALYKPGQEVKYRVFLMDKDMKPKADIFDVTIYDANGNTIKIDHGVDSLFGTSGELQLSDQPVLGMWRIEAKCREKDETQNLNFEVKNYVLPLFEVDVELPPFGTVANPQLKGKVTAKYTYGKPVKGHVTLTVSKSTRYWWFYEPKAIQTEFKIDGESDFSIATNTLLKFDPTLKYDTLVVVAEVKEEESGEIRTGENKIEFHEKPLRLEFQTHDDIFKPGFKYSTYIKVTQPDGRPLSSIGDRLEIDVTYLTDKKSSAATTFRVPQHPSSNLMKFLSPFSGGDVIFMPKMFLPIPRSGMIKLDLDIPENVATGHIDVKLKDIKIDKNIQRFRTVSKAYLQLEMKSAFVQVGKQAEFSIRSNVRPNGKITYHIIKDCRILETHYTYISSPYQNNVFYVTMTSDMIPESKILAYYFNDEHGEIIADAISFSVQTIFKNDVNLRFDRGQVSPGSNVTLNIKADPESQVYVLAVDKSVLLQKTGNDITKDKVYRRLGVTNKPEWKFRDSFLYKRISANDPMGLFQQTCLVPMSDALLYDFDLWSLRPISPRMYEVQVDSGGSWAYGASNTGPSIHTMMDIRQDFPETWIWSNASVGSTGHVALPVTVPDTITDWIATGYALNKKTGLGIASESANLTAYLPFFVNLHFPASIVKNEVAVIQALVFNYYSHDLYVTVTLKNSSKDFISLETDRHSNERENGDILQKCILVKANDVESAYLPVMPLKTGTIDIQVEASSTRGKDTIKRQLVVKPPGIEEEGNHPVMLAASNQEGAEVIMPIFYPVRVVPGSQRIQVTVTGDIFGPSMNNLDKLIKMPYGCGEQNMVRFAPAVYAAQYLTNVNRKLDGELQEKIKLYLQTGYQRQLTYMRYDGSFSAFGQSDKEGSVWLTAFVLKTFAQASKFTFIETSIVERGMMFILQQQNKDGSFNQTGFVHNKAMQGATTGSSVSLTAYIVSALSEVQSINVIKNITLSEEVKSSVLKALKFLENSKSKITSDYDLAITAYTATTLKINNFTDDLLKRLESSVRFVTGNGNMQHWQHESRSVEIEIASYALLVYVNKADDVRGYPILEWLIDRRTTHGGFVSTQDTVVALQALSAVATQTYDADINMTVNIDYGGENVSTVHITPNNTDILQFVDVPAETTSLTLTATGKGTGLVEVSSFYNVLTDENHPSLNLEVTTNATNVKRFNLTTCTRWLGSDDSGMVLVEIGLPSGYKLAPKHSQTGKRTSRTETVDGKFVLYYDKLGRESTCYIVGVIRDSIVGRIQSASVRVYSYYNPEISAQKFYTLDVPNKSLCDFCGVKCGCGYNPDAVPEARCSGIVRNYHNTFKTIHNVVHNTLPPINPNGPFKRVVQTIEGPEADIIYRQQLQPNRWHRGQPLPVSMSSRRTVKQTFPTMPGNVPVSMSSRRTVKQTFPAMPGNVPVSMTKSRTVKGSRPTIPNNVPVTFSRRRTVEQTYPAISNTVPIMHRRWRVNQG